MEIGKRIKQLRKRNGLTLDELASRSELSKGFLSQLENDLTSPSITTLDDILEALGSSLSEFFSEDKDERVVFHRDDFYMDERDTHTVHWIVPNSQKHQMEPVLVEIPQGGRSFEMQPHNGEEFVYVLEGTVQFNCDDRTYTVRRGETVYLQGKSFHCFENKNKTPAKILWISTPPLF